MSVSAVVPRDSLKGEALPGSGLPRASVPLKERRWGSFDMRGLHRALHTLSQSLVRTTLSKLSGTWTGKCFRHLAGHRAIERCTISHILHRLQEVRLQDAPQETFFCVCEVYDFSPLLPFFQ